MAYVFLKKRSSKGNAINNPSPDHKQYLNVSAILSPPTKPCIDSNIANAPTDHAVIKQAKPLSLFNRSQSHNFFKPNISAL